jgi:hypothetical protein
LNELCIALTAHHRTTIYVNGPIGARMPSVIREVSDPMARALLLHMLIASSCATLTSAPATDETEPSHDAFGSRIGVESLGLYSESRFQTRNENHGAILTSTDADNGWGFSSMKVNCELRTGGQRGALTDAFDGDFGVAERHGICSRQRSRVPQTRVPHVLREGPRR